MFVVADYEPGISVVADYTIITEQTKAAPPAYSHFPTANNAALLPRFSPQIWHYLERLQLPMFARLEPRYCTS